MKKIILGLFVAVLFLTSICFTDESPKETELLFMAKKAYEDGFYEVSLGMLERFLKDFSGSTQEAQVMLLSGQCYFQQGRYLEALSIFEKLVNDPQAANFKDAVYFWMGEVHFKGGNFEKSALLYRKLVDNFPHSSYAPLAYYSLGWSLTQTGKYEQAYQVFIILLEKFPSEPQSKDAAFKLIECLYNLKRYSQLQSKVKSVLKLYANDRLRLPYLYFYLAESQYYLDNFDEAIKDYLKSVQAFEKEKAGSLAKLGLVWPYLKLGKYKEAEGVLADIKEPDLDKKGLDIFILAKAVLMNQTNRVYEAKKLYEQLIEVSSDPLMRMQAYLGKADALYNLAEYKQATGVYREGLDKIDPSALPKELIDRMRYNLALACIKAGEVSSGIAIFEDILGRSKDQSANVSILFQLGDAYKEEGEFVKAEEAFIRAVKSYPDSAYIDYAQYQLGLLKLQKNDYDGAIISFKSILNDYPQSNLLPDSLYSLGAAYFQKEDYAASLEIFSKFTNQYKDNLLSPQASYMLGNSFLNLGRTEDALSIFKEMLKLYPQDLQLRQKVEYEIGDCYYRLGHKVEALSQFKLLRAKYPDSKLAPDIMCWLGQYYYRSNDLVLARRYFSSLIKDFPDNRLAADAFYALGLISSAEDKFEQAIDEFKKALALGNKDASFNLAEALEANSEPDAALKQYLLSADLDKQDSYSSVLALLRAAKIYEDQGNFKDALPVYRRVVQKNTPEAKFAQDRIEWISSRN